MKSAGLALAAVVAALGLSWPVAAVGRVKARPRCQILVTNKTPYRVLIHVDGVYWGWVNAQRSFMFRGVPGGDILVYGSTQYGEFFWGPKGVRCEHSATWELGF